MTATYTAASPGSSRPRQRAGETDLPDTRICEACAGEILDPANRRFGYALASCPWCGPRFSIARALPFERGNTTMAAFPPCAACLAEYHDPWNRRFHDETIACPDCGPGISLRGPRAAKGEAAIAAAVALLRQGEIVAIKGPGGYQFACDATNATAVERLRAQLPDGGEPFPLMARSVGVISRYCTVSPEEKRALTDPRASVVVLPARWSRKLPNAVAPGLATIGFMLPVTPLQVLLLNDLTEPLVMTAAGRSRIGDDMSPLAPDIAAHVLDHDRVIANRGGVSVVRVMDGEPRVLRRGLGHSHAAIDLPLGFERAPDLLALGCERRAAFCLIKDGQAILSPPHGDLEHPAAFDDYRRNLGIYRDLFAHAPLAVAADSHPDDRGARLARTMRRSPRFVPHHHAHVASCLCENGYPLDGAPVLGITLDGAGGGEFLLADYRRCRRLATLPSGDGLFAEVASALGLRARHETGAAARLEAQAEHGRGEGIPYRFALSLAEDDGLPRRLDPAPMWHALFDDLASATPASTIAARFHHGLAAAIAETAVVLARSDDFRVVALSGDCFANRLLFEQTTRRLTAAGFVVLTHARVPGDDGGLSLGQAAVVAAWLIAKVPAAEDPSGPPIPPGTPPHQPDPDLPVPIEEPPLPIPIPPNEPPPPIVAGG